MRPRIATILTALLLLVGAAAHAQDLCAPLTRLLTQAPAAFAAQRTGPDGDQQWTANPVVPHATCGLWQSRAGDADTLRCNINDHAPAAEVDAFYQANLAVIDRCLAGLPGLGHWDRTTRPVAAEGLRGSETTWVHDTDKLRFSIGLASFLRTVTNTSYDRLVVEHLRY